MLGRRVLALDAERERLKVLLGALVEETAPQLLELFGVGVDTAATLLVTAGDQPRVDPLGGPMGTRVRRGSHRGLFGQGDPCPA